MAESRYNRLDNQSPTQSQLQNEDLRIPRSAFDFSTIHSGNAIIGSLIPVDCFDVVPGENISISMANLLEFRNPTTRQLLNGFRVYFHGYYNRLTDLWEGAQNFLDTGLSGKISKTRPNLIYHASKDYVGDDNHIVYANACTPCSLLNYLGLPSEVLQKPVDSSSKVTPLRSFHTALKVTDNTDVYCDYDKLGESVDFFPADCAFAYQRNWRDYYCNRNLLSDNKYWFPDNEHHFILSYECENAVCLNYGDDSLEDNVVYQIDNLVGEVDYTSSDPETSIFSQTNEPNLPISSASFDDGPVYYAPNLSGLKFRQFRGDRFTTALPFPDLIRGDIPVVNINGSRLNLEYFSTDNTYHKLGIEKEADVFIAGSEETESLVLDDTDKAFLFATVSNFAPDPDLSVKIPLSQITQNALRALETFTVFKERSARIKNTDTFYNGFIEAQFGMSPNEHNPRGTYLGGFYQDFALSSVTQLSESTASSPLGQKAGQGVSNGNGTICNDFYCSDFGWIQIYMSVVPDVFYTQGKPRMFSKKSQLDMYFPLFNNLEPQAILNKELFVSGTESTDNDVFAYEDRYAEYKSRPNRVSGFMALSHSVAEFDSSRIMARRFDSTPVLNNEFVYMVPENIDMQVFSSYDEPPFDFSCGISVRRVFPGPYTAVPGSLSSNIHA